MIWQDLVISFANLLFVFSLVNQVAHGFKNKKSYVVAKASFPTLVGLYAMCLAFLTLQLYLSSIITFITGSLWLTLFIQSKIYKHAN